MVVLEEDCYVCKCQRGEIKPDRVEKRTIEVMGEMVPVEQSVITIEYQDTWGYWHQYPLCPAHQSMVDNARRLGLFFPPPESRTEPDENKRE